MKTSPLFEIGSDQVEAQQMLQTARRRTRLAIMPLGDARQGYEQEIKAWHREFNLSLLERALVRLSLRSKGTTGEFIKAWDEAKRDVNALSREISLAQCTYCMNIMGALETIWTTPPFNDPSLIIYSADVSRYIDDAMAIEVQYREALPS